MFFRFPPLTIHIAPIFPLNFQITPKFPILFNESTSDWLIFRFQSPRNQRHPCLAILNVKSGSVLIFSCFSWYFCSEKILFMFLLQCLIKLKFHPRYQYDFGLFFWLLLFGICICIVWLPPLVSTFVWLLSQLYLCSKVCVKKVVSVFIFGRNFSSICRIIKSLVSLERY